MRNSNLDIIKKKSVSKYLAKDTVVNKKKVLILIFYLIELNQIREMSLEKNCIFQLGPQLA